MMKSLKIYGRGDINYERLCFPSYFVHFRVGKSNGIALGTGIALYTDGRYGPLHISRENLYAVQNAFMVPKSSPLYASKS